MCLSPLLFSYICRSSIYLVTWFWLKPWRDKYDACGVEIRMYEMHGVGAFAQIPQKEIDSPQISVLH